MALKLDRNKLRPMAAYIVIRKDQPDKTDGGLHVPDTAKSKYGAAVRGSIVFAVGPGRITAEGKVVEPRLRPGYRVWLHSECNAMAIPWDPDLAIVHEDEVICYIDESGDHN